MVGRGSLPLCGGAGLSESFASAAEEDEDGEQDDAAQEERRGSHAHAGPAGAPDQAPGQFYGKTPEGTRFSAGCFGDLHLSRPLQKACAALGYTHPTPIQVPIPDLSAAARLRLRIVEAQSIALISLGTFMHSSNATAFAGLLECVIWYSRLAYTRVKRHMMRQAIPLRRLQP